MSDQAEARRLRAKARELAGSYRKYFGSDSDSDSEYIYSSDSDSDSDYGTFTGKVSKNSSYDCMRTTYSIAKNIAILDNSNISDSNIEFAIIYALKHKFSKKVVDHLMKYERYDTSDLMGYAIIAQLPLNDIKYLVKHEVLVQHSIIMTMLACDTDIEIAKYILKSYGLTYTYDEISRTSYRGKLFDYLTQ